jgi:hypothetical protein
MRKSVTVAPRPLHYNAEERQQHLERIVSEFLVTAHQLNVSSDEIHAEIDRQWPGATMLEMQRS